MTQIKVFTQGGKAIERALDERHKAIMRNSRSATNASAKVFRKKVQEALPRRSGNLRRHVRIFPVGESAWKVKITGAIARFFIGGTKEHEIAPRGIQAAQSTFHHSGKRGVMAGPALAKRAISYPGASHPFPRAIVPAHEGDQTVIPRAKAEGAEAARAAAFEVLRQR